MANRKTTDAELERQIAAARKRGAQNSKFDPKAVSVVHKNGETRVTLETGWSFSFDPRKLSEFAGAGDKDLADVRPMGDGSTLGWETLDQHIGVGAIIVELLGEHYLRSLTARLLGSKSSAIKAATARANGARGGRPVGSKDSRPRTRTVKDGED